MARPTFHVHTTRRILVDAPIAAPIVPETLASARFAGPAPRPVRDGERLYISGAFTVAELERIAIWARGGEPR